MKTLSVKDLAQEGVSRAIREAEGDPVLISKNNRPAVWMISASALGRAVAAVGGDPDLYRSALQVLAVKLFDGGMLSLGRAAELAGLPLTDFMDLCGALHVPVYRPPQEGLDAEVRAFETWLHATKGTPSSRNLGGAQAGPPRNVAIFVDASPLIGLARIGRLDLLALLPPPISITTAVWDEVTRDATKPGVEAIQQAAAAGTFSVVLAGNPAEYPFLGRGEAQTLSAARMVGAAVIMDDAEARRFRDNDPALAAAIPSVITTVGLVLLAKRAGAITRVQTLLDALMAEQLYVHPAVYEQALRAAGEWPPV